MVHSTRCTYVYSFSFAVPRTVLPDRNFDSCPTSQGKTTGPSLCAEPPVLGNRAFPAHGPWQWALTPPRYRYRFAFRSNLQCQSRSRSVCLLYIPPPFRTPTCDMSRRKSQLHRRYIGVLKCTNKRRCGLYVACRGGERL